MRQRKYINVNGVRLAYIDFGGKGTPFIALHGHSSCASLYGRLAEVLKDKYHVIALDQRGHGWSEHPGVYTREAYINDIVKFMKALKLPEAVFFGHSMGGVNAYQLANRHPELVKAIIVEDVGTNIDIHLDFLESWPKRFPSAGMMWDFLSQNPFLNVKYFMESAVEFEDGWGFRFDGKEIAASQRNLMGNWQQDWMGSDCPALLLHGNKSWAMTNQNAYEMAKRPNTILAEFPDATHFIQEEAPEHFYDTILKFLTKIEGGEKV